MPEFAPGGAKTAVAPITVSPAGLSCEAEVFLGPDEATKVATSGRIVFTSTGASQSVRLPVAMPTIEGTYHVYIDVYAEDLLIAAYQAIEDVVIVPVGAPEFVYVSTLRRWWTGGADFDTGWSVDIQNIGDKAGDCTLEFYNRMREPGVECPNWSSFHFGDSQKAQTKTIQPGEVVTFSGECFVGPYTIQFMVKSPAGVLLNPTLPLEYICRVCAWLYCTDTIAFTTQEELDAHMAREHPEYA